MEQLQSNSKPHNSEPLNRIRKKCNRFNESFRRRIILGEAIIIVKLYRKKQLATKLNLEEKWNTNWPFVSDIERIMISNCETIDHSVKECLHKASRKLLFDLTREKHSCSDACGEKKDYREMEIKWSAHQTVLIVRGKKTDYIETMNRGDNPQNWSEAKPTRTKDPHTLIEKASKIRIFCNPSILNWSWNHPKRISRNLAIFDHEKTIEHQKL